MSISVLVSTVVILMLRADAPNSGSPESLVDLENGPGVVIQIQVEGQAVRAIVDTGSPISLATPDFLSRVAAATTPPPDFDVEIGQVGFRVPIKPFEAAAAGRVKAYWNADVLLGMDSLSHTVMGIDFQARRLAIWKPEDSSAASRFWFSRDLVLVPQGTVKWTRTGFVPYIPAPDGKTQVLTTSQTESDIHSLLRSATVNGMLTAPVSFDQSNVVAMLDTAAPQSMLSAASAEQLKDKKVLRTEVVGWIDGMKEGERVEIKNTVVAGVPVKIAEGIHVSERAPDVLGLDALRQFRLFFDFKQQVVLGARFSESRPQFLGAAMAYSKDGKQAEIFPGDSAIVKDLIWVEGPKGLIEVAAPEGEYTLVRYKR
ncbi:MAG: hypothetical protein J0H02_13645 [Armatimonadetes bacterium]|nr:hypothetical protein [Armatimonadota bacterium]